MERTPNNPPFQLELRVPAVEGSIVPYDEMTHRVDRLIEALPGLHQDLAAHLQGDEQIISFERMTQILRDASLRPETILEWDSDYFDDQFEEIVRIASKRRGYTISED